MLGNNVRQSYQYFANLWNSNSGEWTWIAEKSVPLASLNRSLWRSSVPSLNFYTLLLLSGIISTLGLLANSAATIIGAMIVAPLMGPIVSMAFAMVMGNRRLLKRSSLTLWTGVALTILTAFLVCKLIGLRTYNAEIMGRVRPTLIDMGVALAAGAVGAFAQSRRGVSDALPGVAIAVALVPPLSVVGIGLALASRSVSVGASLLFLANLTGIIFSGAMVFLLQRYGSFSKAREGLVLAVVALSLLCLPLLFSLQNLLVRENVRRHVEDLIVSSTLTFSKTEVRQVQVRREGEILFVELEVAAPLGSISENQVNLVRDFLEKQLKRSISLNVQVIPLTEFKAPARSAAG
jgi:uncharacterized hydrophobic protein (TIGR00271 family)